MEEHFKFINDADINSNVGTSKSAANTIESTQWIVNLNSVLYILLSLLQTPIFFSIIMV
jgi:hypothetical protein